MELKIVLCAIIIISGYIGGRFIAESMKKRRDDLKELICGFTEMQTCITSASLPLYVIFDKLKSETDVGKMFGEFAESSEKDNEKMWRSGLSRLNISSEDCERILPFVKKLGAENTEHQKKELDMCINELAKRLEEAEGKYCKEGMLCKKLGIYAGILLVLFLI